MKKDKTEDLLKQMQNLQHNMLGDVYGDFFQAERPAAERREEEHGTAEPVTEEYAKTERPEAGTAESDPVQQAQNALSEFEIRIKEAEQNGVMPADAAGKMAAAQTSEQKSAEEAKEPEEDPMEELENLVGLSKIKEDVKELTAFVKVQKARKDAGLKAVPVSLHLVFTGNPGTGKTSVARIIARLYRQIGVLSKGQLVETDRSGLVAGFVGQTAIKTSEQIKKAMGGVLFIDEAYTLAQKDDAFGQEAIDTLLKAMEDHRDDFVVIVAGYTKPMETFINSNPGLKSRFNKYIEFPDYSAEELLTIFERNCKKYDYLLEEDARTHVKERIDQRQLAAVDNFANAREVRNLFEEIITNQARRVSALKDPAPEDMMRITNEDIL